MTRFEFLVITDEHTILIEAELIEDMHVYHVSGRVEDRLVTSEHVDADADIWTKARQVASDLQITYGE